VDIIGGGENQLRSGQREPTGVPPKREKARGQSHRERKQQRRQKDKDASQRTNTEGMIPEGDRRITHRQEKALSRTKESEN